MKKLARYGKAAVAFLLFVAIAIGVVVLAGRVTAVPVDTYHSSWHLVRTLAEEDATTFATCLALATSEGDFANKPSGAFQIPSTKAGVGAHEGISAGGAWMFVFGVSTEDTDDDSETFSFTLVGWAKTNGMAQVICEGEGAAGAQDVVIYPGGSATDANDTWADTVTLDETTKWPSVAAFNSGADEVAMVLADMTGLEYVYPFIYDACDAGQAQAVAVYGRRY